LKSDFDVLGVLVQLSFSTDDYRAGVVILHDRSLDLDVKIKY
jgi:hypothetical protein